MRKLLLLFTAFFSLLFGCSASPKTLVVAPDDFYKLSFNSISGEKIDFSSLKGKKILIVNTASKCGFTPQFEGLEELFQKHKDKLVILGFPSNEFKEQDPGSNTEIAEFCQLNYGVSFMMMEKSEVKGDGQNKVYQWLSDKNLNGWNDDSPSWNFCKYLIDENGNLLAFFPSTVKPMSEEIELLIAK